MERKRKGGGEGHKFVVRWELPPISFPCPSQACQSWEPRQIKLSGACRETAPLTESVIAVLGGARGRGNEAGKKLRRGQCPLLPE